MKRSTGRRLLHVTRVASQFFSEQLWLASPDALAWRALTRRGLQEGTLRSFGIGLAPPSWNALSSVLHEAQLTDDGLNVGLLTLRKDGRGDIDTFRNRLMVPLRSPDGDTHGFCGRLLLGEGPSLLEAQ